MNDKLKQIETEISSIKNGLMTLGELRPGSLSKQFNVCGTPGCKCKDKEDPKKHGPYYQISYCRKGKSSSAFVRPEFVAEVEQQLATYKRLMELVNRWVDLGLEHSQLKLKLAREKSKKAK